jgi:hypothetical protein
MNYMIGKLAMKKKHGVEEQRTIYLKYEETPLNNFFGYYYSENYEYFKKANLSNIKASYIEVSPILLHSVIQYFMNCPSKLKEKHSNIWGALYILEGNFLTKLTSEEVPTLSSQPNVAWEPEVNNQNSFNYFDHCFKNQFPTTSLHSVTLISSGEATYHHNRIFQDLFLAYFLEEAEGYSEHVYEKPSITDFYLINVAKVALKDKNIAKEVMAFSKWLGDIIKDQALYTGHDYARNC